MQAERIIERADQIQGERLRALYAYWRAKAADRIGPQREEIRPEEIKKLLPWIWLADVVDGGVDYRFRLGGEEIVKFMGTRLAGTLLSAQPPVSFFQNMRARFDACVRAKAPIMIGPARTTHQPSSFLEVSALLLPSSENGVDVSMLFGAIEVRPAYAAAK